MALVIEDGTLVANAYSFVTRAEIIAYAASRGVTIADTADADILAVKAMDYLWTLCFAGDLVSEEQGTPFPRSGLVDGDTAEGYEYTIPAGIKRAQMQLALDSHNGIDLTPSANPDAALKRSKIGPIEEEFFEAESLTLTGAAPLTVANALLAPFLCDSGSMLIRTVRV